MTRKKRRLVLLLVCGLGVGSAAALTLFAFSDNLVFFVTPSDLAKNNPGTRSVRLGGLVEQGTLVRSTAGDPTARFAVTDGTARVKVTYRGLLPDLFREGQGVVALGAMQPDGTFKASEVLAKHDENYMPKEVAEALKKSGQWNPASGAAPPPASTWNTPANNPTAKTGS
ncbi:MAG: cytochrome c maturation protein CcmE [Acetobacteraceae bacterium]|nr:cytochrome c maturation protein CcmE [Pseudomonadota bacterium]